MAEVGVSMGCDDDVLPLFDMGDALRGIVLEEKHATHAGVELVLNTLPRGEIGSILIPVLPDGAPGSEDGTWGRRADLVGGGDAALEDAVDHERMGVTVEGVELGGDVRGWINEGPMLRIGSEIGIVRR